MQRRIERMIEEPANSAHSRRLLAMRTEDDEFRDELIELYMRNLAPEERCTTPFGRYMMSIEIM